MAASVPVVSAGSIDQRFAQLIQQFGLTKNSFAISLGKTASVVQHLIDGRNKPGFDLMCKVFEVYPNVSRDWLLLGRGPMLIGNNGSVAAPAVPAEPSAPEPGFEPIDLSDVAPRVARRPTITRLHPEEIAATLALASAAATGSTAADAVLPVPSTSEDAEPNSPLSTPITQGPVNLTPQSPKKEAEISGQRPARPFRPVSTPASQRVAEFATNEPTRQSAPISTPSTPVETPLPPPASIQSAIAAPAGAPAPTALHSPDAYVAAAIHAQHLQHQLALAELRNQHLLEQQQMLREMLAMARQGMV